jgi:hypothetical protein
MGDFFGVVEHCFLVLFLLFVPFVFDVLCHFLEVSNFAPGFFEVVALMLHIFLFLF